MSRPLSQVLETAARAKRESYAQLDAVNELEMAWKSREALPSAFYDFIPIRLVTIIESQVRLEVARAINFSEPFTTNATKLIDRWSAAQVLQALMAITQRKLTIGELAAHSFTVGSFAELISNLDKIFGPEVETKLQDAQELWLESAGEENPKIINDYKTTKRHISKLFHVRHILVHENPSKCPYEIADVESFIEHTRQFVGALHWFGIGQTVGPVPETQAMMTAEARSTADAALKSLWDLRGMTKEEAAQRTTRQERIEAAWDEFVSLSAEEEASEYEGGSMQPMVRSTAEASLNYWRIARVRDEAQRDEES